MEFEQFASVTWDYEDVKFVGGDDVTIEEGEQFLKDNEEKIRHFICRVGIEFLERLWNDQHAEED